MGPEHEAHEIFLALGEGPNKVSDLITHNPQPVGNVPTNMVIQAQSYWRRYYSSVRGNYEQRIDTGSTKKVTTLGNTQAEIKRKRKAGAIAADLPLATREDHVTSLGPIRKPKIYL